MKKALCAATVASNLDNFNRSNVQLLQELGYEVTLAANFDAGEDSSPQEKIDAFRTEMNAQGVKTIQIDFSRHPGNLKAQLRSIRQVKELLKKNHYDLIHCHTPIASVIVRAAANRYRKGSPGDRRWAGEINEDHGRTGESKNREDNCGFAENEGRTEDKVRVIYTAHGFHFFKGAPRKNWLIYYPLERWASRFTDVLITINREDYELAKQKFHAGKVVQIPGVGIDTGRYAAASGDPEVRKRKRKELGFPEKDIVLISVGELNSNKNHELAIRAVGKVLERVQKEPGTSAQNTSVPEASAAKKIAPETVMHGPGHENGPDRDQNQGPRVQYLIAGHGERKSDLEGLAESLGIGDAVHLLGYRTDIPELLAASDIFLFPSKREGLPTSVLEAMAAGLPCVVTDVRGSRELVRDGVDGYVTGFSETEFAERIGLLAGNPAAVNKMGESAQMKSLRFDQAAVREAMRNIYEIF